VRLLAPRGPATMAPMNTILVATQCVLAAVFAVAGIAKLLDLPGSRKAVAEFGVPEPAAGAIGSVLPVAEIATAVGLVFVATATAASVVALALLIAFIGGISNAMRRGEAPDCNCFGQVHSSPAGWPTLARNAVLAALAVLVLVKGPGPAIDGWVSDRSAAEIAAIGLGLCVLAFAAYAWRLRKANVTLQQDLQKARSNAGEPEFVAEGLPLGEPAPDFALPDPTGIRRSFASVRQPRTGTVLFFTSPDCAPCNALVEDLARWQTTLGDRVTIAVVASGSEELNGRFFAGHEMVNVFLDTEGEVFEAFNVRSTPSAIALDSEGLVSSAPAGGLHMPEVLIRLMIRNGSTAQDEGRGARPFTVLQSQPRAS